MAAFNSNERPRLGLRLDVVHGFNFFRADSLHAVGAWPNPAFGARS
jgi:hypothetical protein